MLHKICTICDTAFERTSNRQKFCSRKCYRRNTYLRFYAKHGDRKRELNKQYYINNHEDQLAYRRERYHTKIRFLDLQSRLDNPWYFLLGAAKQRAKKKNLPFDLNETWARERWTGLCELTKIPFVINEGRKLKSFSPSIDKVVPSLGYIKTNCRFILRAVNCLKLDGTDKDMLAIARSLCQNYPTKA